MAENTKKALKTLPPLTLSLITGSFLLVLICSVLLIFPQYQNVKNVKKDRVSKFILLEKQKKMFPLYAQAKALADRKFEPLLPLSDREALDRKEISNLSTIFSAIASENNMDLTQNNLDAASFKNHSGSLSMDVQLTGDLYDFRNCLIAFAQLPFFKRIEKIVITTDQALVKKFSTKILLNINKK